MGSRYSPKHVAGQIVLRQGQEIAHRLVRFNFESASGKFCLTLRQDVIETCPQARLSVVAIDVRFTEAVNHRAFQRRGEIGGRFGSFSVIRGWITNLAASWASTLVDRDLL